MFKPTTGAGLILALLLMVAVATRTARSQEPTPEPAPMGTEESWLILPEFPETATQADIGAEIYRLVCRSCHGDRGQGLTRDWIAQWAPEDQNCWQSHCHGGLIPPDGFALPRMVPPVIGDDALDEFDTAEALYDFSREQMPWHAPGSLVDREYMQVTAYLLRENGFPVDDVALDETTAATFILHPEEAVATGTPVVMTMAPSAEPRETSSWYLLAIVAVVGFVLALGVRLLWRR